MLVFELLAEPPLNLIFSYPYVINCCTEIMVKIADMITNDNATHEPYASAISFTRAKYAVKYIVCSGTTSTT